MHITLPCTVNHKLKIAVPVVRADAVRTNLNRTELPIIITHVHTGHLIVTLCWSLCLEGQVWLEVFVCTWGVK